MSGLVPLAAPATDIAEVATYVANPRAKRSFNTILDASHLFSSSGHSKVATTVKRENGERRLEINTEHQLQGGTITETLELSAQGSLNALRLHRRLTDDDGYVSREERIDFARGPFKAPVATYPEVMLPFVLRFQPVDSTRRSLHAWIVDRFVARVYCEWRGHHAVTVPAGTFDTVEMMMYPDLNDWVNLGSMINTLAKPLLPKYRMWFEANAPHRVVRFEGPYGPPGAPEIVLELAK
jgi:hypothetical protein